MQREHCYQTLMYKVHIVTDLVPILTAFQSYNNLPNSGIVSRMTKTNFLIDNCTYDTSKSYERYATDYKTFNVIDIVGYNRSYGIYCNNII